MDKEVQEKLREIKGRFRLMMNGVASQSMREKGLGYKLNWGIALPLLKQMALDYGKNFELAVELWKEDIRECRILATMIMPSERMEPDLVDIWVSDIRNQEMASIASYNLLQYIDGAKGFAFNWIASSDELLQLCGYYVMARLFMNGEHLDIREIHEYIDQVKTVLDGDSMTVKHAAANSLTRFASIDDDCGNIAKSAFKTYDMDIFQP